MVKVLGVRLGVVCGGRVAACFVLGRHTKFGSFVPAGFRASSYSPLICAQKPDRRRKEDLVLSVKLIYAGVGPPNLLIVPGEVSKILTCTEGPTCTSVLKQF